ncbi:MarR family winged helix-turn-helix transcriptional regulator [Cryptosporangium sp. NPDC051539]|uniref:MarR family winged helix-turn-helix transcriptional regulator n=1 Tax=Cryptosporangium sp. NPDC051539 TaxID=3363962 RepID=UPI003791B7EF
MATRRQRGQDDVAEPRWLAPDELDAWRALAKLMARLPAALDRQLQRDARLSYVEYYVLAGLSERPGRSMRLYHLAEMVNVELSRLSHMINRLERRGLVRREPDPTDRRSTLAVLTDEGHAHLAAVAPGHVQRVRELLIDALGREELLALGEASKHVTARLEALD